MFSDNKKRIVEPIFHFSNDCQELLVIYPTVPNGMMRLSAPDKKHGSKKLHLKHSYQMTKGECQIPYILDVVKGQLKGFYYGMHADTHLYIDKSLNLAIAGKFISLDESGISSLKKWINTILVPFRELYKVKVKDIE